MCGAIITRTHSRRIYIDAHDLPFRAYDDDDDVRGEGGRTRTGHKGC